MLASRKFSRSGEDDWSQNGFTLLEILGALVVLTFGLLSVGQLMYLALSSTTLARSKGTAAVVAQDKIDFLADLYRREPWHESLTNGNHGPEAIRITNPLDNTVLNRFNMAWTVSPVADPRAGKTLKARQLSITVTPIGFGTDINKRTSLNKVVNFSAILSPQIQ